MRQIRLVSGFVTVGAWTMASRVLGFVRDILIAAFLGTGPVAEAFLIAFALPNMFRRFFAEGAFNMAFVPMFSKRLDSDEDEAEFAQDAMMGLASVLVVFTVVAIIAMPLLVMAMASGFSGDQRFDLTVAYGRIVFVYILFISLAALLSGVLNAIGRFAVAAAAPVLLNIVLVGVLLLAETGILEDRIVIGALAGGSRQDLHHGDLLAIGVVIAGAGQLALLWIATLRAGYRFALRPPKLTPELRRLAVIAAPAALAGGVVQINLLIGRQVASFFEGAVGWLSYADRLYQLPLGVVGIAIGVVLLPDLSRRLRSEDVDGGRHAFNRAAEISLALTVPAAVALAVIPMPLVSVLFERGAFDSADTRATAIAVAIYALGLPAFVLQKVLQPLYFAREDTKTPFYYALAALVINAVIAIGLAPVIGFTAAAFGTTIAGWGMAALLWVGSRGMGAAAQLDERFVNRVWRIIAAAIAMGALLWVSAGLLAPFLELPGTRYGALAALIAIGIVGYFGAGRVTGAFSITDFREALKR